MTSPFIIAEIAQGYEGRPEQARLLVMAASSAGAHAVKFQLVYAEELATPDYQHYDLFRKLEMPDTEWHQLSNLARERNLQFHLDIFGPRSLRLAQEVGAQAVKIHSTDMSNPGLLEAVAQCRVPRVILSAGGCTREEIDRALRLLSLKEIILLHGFQGYPTATAANRIVRLHEFAKLRALHAGLQLGFADHADPDSPQSILLAASALGAGATVIEKHLTLARNLKLEDYESALNPDEFAGFVANLRDCAIALGEAASANADFGMHESELGYRALTRKHVVASRDLKAGTVLASADLALKRTAAKIFINDVDAVIGRRIKQSITADQAISPDLLEPRA